MTDPAPSPLPAISRLTLDELWASLKAGVWDFRRAPQFGLVFSAVYVLGGFALIWLGEGTVGRTLTIGLGFPLVAPFAALGLYEVSRRLEADEPLDWGPIVAVIWRGRQIRWCGAIIVIHVLVWTFLADLIFAFFMGDATLTDVSQSWQVLLGPHGLEMAAAEIVVGAVLAFVLFSITVVSLPLLLEREVNLATAMRLSIRTVARNPAVMTVWAFVIAVLTIVALLPWFLGLMVVFPVLGHATWHLYRRALYDEV